MPNEPPTLLIVAGPTCSGKSALALTLAQRLRGTVINADSMQVYREIPILSARPTPAEEALVPHRLYGIRSAAEPGSVAWWCTEARAAIAEAHAARRRPILCGGTGLYLATLVGGIAPIPEPAAPIRAQARTLLADIGPQALHARLALADPATAATLEPNDGQRLARAWEVLAATGIGLAAWHAAPAEPMPHPVRMILLDPPRPTLRAAIATRFAAMLAQGALDEARFLRHLDPTLPALRALGIPELLAHLRGDLTLEQAERAAILATGRYTKRQSTWFRHRPPIPPDRTHTIHARFAGLQQFSEREWADIEDFVSEPGASPARGTCP